MGFENENECFCGTATEPIDKHGAHNNCKNGMGGRWSMDVYLLTDSKVSKPPSQSPTTLEPTRNPTLSPTNSFKYTELGCYRDSRDRLFQYRHDDLNLGLAQCANMCFTGNYAYMGYEDGKECFCGLSTEAYTKHGTSSSCRTDENGNGIGGSWSMTVYKVSSQLETAAPTQPETTTTTNAPVTSAAPTAELTEEPTRATERPTSSPTTQPTDVPTETSLLRQALGCWTDTSDRMFKHRHSDDGLSIDACQRICYEGGYHYLGRQYQVECYCGTEAEGLTYQRYGSSNKCTNGLGGGWAADVYRIFTPGATDNTLEPTKAPATAVPTNAPSGAPTTNLVYTSLGCWRDDRSRSFDFIYSKDDIGLPACAIACNALKFPLMGYQDGKECYCGNENDDYRRLGSSNNCDAGQGGGWSMDVYQIKSTLQPTSQTAETPSPTQTNATPNAAPVAAWQHLGCFKDETDDRVLPHRVEAGDQTLQKCASACEQFNPPMPLMGIQDGSECWCAPLETVPDKHGVATCNGDGLGGSFAFDAYFLTFVQNQG